MAEAGYEVKSAAQHVASRMSRMIHENGVTSAVASFHRNIPANDMRCHALSSEPAVWQVKKSSKNPMNISKLAVEVLVDHCRLNPANLYREHSCRSSPIMKYANKTHLPCQTDFHKEPAMEYSDRLRLFIDRDQH